ncbi:MFS transporter [Roseomonas eburnea]|uniref:MFS transporter n=1 Tax=Neoroseomonas eburnea TaxID=1346889 RepID=A0A9X9XKC5_9PROT|nr:MFS transporter [Neoroseomonas eburnea]MBR0684161.1 MFS transporter [Neoroseomonas eburnea]
MATSPGFARITLPLAAINFLNQGNRALVATIGPLLAIEFGLSASELGLLAATFFAAYAAAQLPIGVALDLHGPRRVQSTLALVAAAGFVVSALAPDVLVLGCGRLITGVGVAAGLMAMLKANTQWYPKHRVAAVTGAGLFFAGLGGVAATVPVQWVLPLLGWRGIFAVLAVLAVAVSLWIRLVVPDRPPDVVASERRSLVREIGEFGRIFRDRGFLRFLPAVMVLSALNFTFQGLWAGPWLRDVGGMADGPRALALLIYAAGLVTGSLVTGQAASLAQARGFSAMFVPYLGIGGVLAAQAALVAGPSGFWGIAVVWFLFSFCGSVGVAGYAAMGQGFPPELQGRVATAINFAMLILVFALQTGIGAIIDLWPRTASGGWDPTGYRVALSMTFLLQAGTALWIVVAPRGRAG